jgi:hypothetical protein
MMLERLFAPSMLRGAVQLGTIVLMATIWGVVAQSADAVTGGQYDGQHHPYVAMLIPPGSSTPSCSGVLVKQGSGNSVVLLTAHCFAGTGRRSGTGYTLTFDPTARADSARAPGTFYIDPRYRRPGDVHDLAVFVLARRAPAAAARLAPVGYLDRAGPSSLTTVGAGDPHRGQRRSAAEVTSGRDSSWQYLRPGTGNSCDFDSGGPDLMPGSAVVVALTDQGTCSWDQDLRVDTGEAHHFVDAPRSWH